MKPPDFLQPQMAGRGPSQLSPETPPLLALPCPSGVSAHVCNEQRYGYMNVPVGRHQGLEDERVNFIHLILESLGEGSLGRPVLPPPQCPWPRPPPHPSFPDSGLQCCYVHYGDKWSAKGPRGCP